VKFFVDTEFFEDGKTIDLISLAVVAEDGRELYLCSREARLDLVGEWHREHVLSQLPPYSNKAWVSRQEIADQLVLFTGHDVPDRGCGDTGTRLAQVKDPTEAHFFAYFADYDWVCICQLYGTMMHLPKHFKRWCYDLKQLAHDRNAPIPSKPTRGGSCFNVGEHNALVDARWNRDLYKLLTTKAWVGQNPPP